MKQKNYIRNRKQAGSRENVRAGQHEKQQENRTQITRSAQKYDSELAATELPARNFFPQYQWTDIWEQFLKSHPANTPFSEKILPVSKSN